MIINKLIYFSGFITRYINFKYFYNLNEIITLFISKKKIIKIKLNLDTYFSFFLKDPYYNRLIYPKFKYEPEIEFLLKKLKDIDFLFLDAGANYGYWSLLVSSKKFNKKKAIALEPLKSNYNFLYKNKLDNKNRFKSLNLGVGEKKKYTKIYYNNKTSNVGASIYKDNDKKLFSEKIKIDKIDNILSKIKEKNFVIKIDIEGNEINALNGAKKILKKNCLIIYEDHASDKFHLNSKYFLKKNFSIFSFDGKKIYQIRKINELNNIKKIKHKGYNFIATRSLLFKKNLY
jgi:FkbM family methyltransferase